MRTGWPGERTDNHPRGHVRDWILQEVGHRPGSWPLAPPPDPSQRCSTRFIFLSETSLCRPGWSRTLYACIGNLAATKAASLTTGLSGVSHHGRPREFSLWKYRVDLVPWSPAWSCQAVTGSWSFRILLSSFRLRWPWLARRCHIARRAQRILRKEVARSAPTEETRPSCEHSRAAPRFLSPPLCSFCFCWAAFCLQAPSATSSVPAQLFPPTPFTAGPLFPGSSHMPFNF